MSAATPSLLTISGKAFKSPVEYNMSYSFARVRTIAKNKTHKPNLIVFHFFKESEIWPD